MLGGIPGSPTDHHGVPYSLTEEFVAVYRMHPLLPDDFTFRSLETDEVLEERSFRELGALHTRARLDELGLPNAFYSLGIAHPGAITLHNYPRFLQHFERPDGTVMDLAATDILRVRERGVPRYNEFRRLFHLKPADSFEELTDNPEWAKELERVYGDVERVDLMVGLYAEPLPKGFGFSDTAFRVFILMASRRLKSDRFFTRDYNAETYTQAGLDWIEESTMIDVLKRHYPELEPALRGVENAFAPWSARGLVKELAEGVHCLGGKKGGRVRAFLLDTGGELTLVDTLFEANGAGVLDAIRRLGRSPSDLKRIVLTHAHRSHLGGLAALKRATGATVLAPRLGSGHRRG